jgi:hypothetical protein
MKRRIPGLAAAFLLAIVATAQAELTAEGWLELYEGKTSERTEAAFGKKLAHEAARLVAATYVLGIADSVIELRAYSCPSGFIPRAGEMADQAAEMVRENQKQSHRGFSMTVAVLLALTINYGCTETRSGK